jgi:hypothetical protein
MSNAWVVQRLGASVMALLVLSAAGCGNSYQSETRIDGKPVIARAQNDDRVAVNKVVNQDIATLTVGSTAFTVDGKQLRWGEANTLALPDNWKRLEFIDRQDYVELKVNGKTFSEIRPRRVGMRVDG